MGGNLDSWDPSFHKPSRFETSEAFDFVDGKSSGQILIPLHGGSVLDLKIVEHRQSGAVHHFIGEGTAFGPLLNEIVFDDRV